MRRVALILGVVGGLGLAWLLLYMADRSSGASVAEVPTFRYRLADHDYVPRYSHLQYSICECGLARSYHS